MARIRDLQKPIVTPSQVEDLRWPADYLPLLEYAPVSVLKWLRKYGIYDNEIVKWRFGWSDEFACLVMPVFDPEGNLLMWQGRNFGGGEPKYLTFGKKSDILYQVGSQKSGILVVTEDLLSAIKVGREYQAAPLWGADMPLGLIKRAAREFDSLGVWLDPNKLKQSVLIALRASQYIPTFVVKSTFDPKDYNLETIIEMVDTAALTPVYKDGIIEPQKHRDPHADIWDEEGGMHQYTKDTRGS